MLKNEHLHIIIPHPPVYLQYKSIFLLTLTYFVQKKKITLTYMVRKMIVHAMLDRRSLSIQKVFLDEVRRKFRVGLV